MLEIKRTMQPTDVDLSKLRYPVLVQPKIDGSKVVRFNGALRGRSFKQYRNRHLNALFDRPEFEGFEGEIIIGTNPHADDLCRLTTSAVNSFEGEPTYTWVLFDYVTEETINLAYNMRLVKLNQYLKTLPEDMVSQLNIVETDKVSCEEQLLATENWYLNKGYEGIIIRDELALYKQGRTTTKSQEVLRLKRFSDSECYIVGFNEKMHNENEATINELGLTTRTSHQENLIGANTLGSINVIDCITGIEFSIGSGFDDDLRKQIWDNKEKYRGAIVKYKFFNKGVKDLPRFPTFLSFRSEIDMVPVGE